MTTGAAIKARPSVSVVVAAYNAAAVIGDCLHSLVELEYPRERLEIIVVDNDSKDATARVAGEFADRVNVLLEPRRGASAARNRGIEHATGDVIAFTDADCVVERSWLTELIAPLADPGVGISGGRILALRPCTRIAELGEDIHDHARAMRSEPPYAITMNWASPASVLRKVGPFDESLLRCQDVDLAYRIAQAGHRFAYAERAVVHHRNRSTLRALLREAYLHGRGSLAVRRIHARYLEAFPPPPPYWRRMRGHLRLFRNVGQRQRAAFRLVFDLGKMGGELRGELR